MPLINPTTLAIAGDALLKHGPKAYKFVQENWSDISTFIKRSSGGHRELEQKLAELVNTLDETERKLSDAEARLASKDLQLAARSGVGFLTIVVAITLCALAAFGLGFGTAHMARI